MRNRTFPLDLIFILSLFLLFTITAVTTVLTGMKVYRHTTDAMEQNYETRTFSSYLTEKIRQNDISGSISVFSSAAPADENRVAEALCLTSYVEEQAYNTYLYFYDGYLRELTVSSEITELSGTAGQSILPAQSFDVAVDDTDLLHIYFVSEDGLSEELYFSIHTKIGGTE